jgi:hypothetical protein
VFGKGSRPPTLCQRVVTGRWRKKEGGGKSEETGSRRGDVCCRYRRDRRNKRNRGSGREEDVAHKSENELARLYSRKTIQKRYGQIFAKIVREGRLQFILEIVKNLKF